MAELAGLPKSVIKKASELLKKFEKDSVKSNKQIMQSESYNMNLFEVNINSSENTRHSRLFDEIIAVDPDKLTPKEALDVLYKLKDMS